jgi:hypothetical protein
VTDFERNAEAIARTIHRVFTAMLGGRATQRQRAPGIADPPAAYSAACDKLRRDGRRLSKMAIAAEMGVDRGTLARYIVEYRLPYPPGR